MNIPALIELRRVVLSAPNHLFHMQAITQNADCGTAHCALGWAQLDSWFAANMRPLLDMYNFCKGTAATLFDIPAADANFLFGGDLERYDNGHPVSKEEVLWNIDELLAGRYALPYKATYEPGPYAMNLEPDDADDDQ